MGIYLNLQRSPRVFYSNNNEETDCSRKKQNKKKLIQMPIFV